MPAVICSLLVKLSRSSRTVALVAVALLLMLPAPRLGAQLKMADKAAEGLFDLLEKANLAGVDQMVALRYFHKHPGHAEAVYSRVVSQDYPYIALIGAAKAWKSGIASDFLPEGYKQYGKGTYQMCMTPTLAVNVLFGAAKKQVEGSGGGLKEFGAATVAENASNDWLNDNVPYWRDIPDICHFSFNTNFPQEQAFANVIRDAYGRPVKAYKAIAAGDYETAFSVLLDAGAIASMVCDYLAVQYQLDAIPVVGNIFHGACNSVASKALQYGVSALKAIGSFAEDTAESLVQDPPMEPAEYYKLYFAGGALGYNPIATSVMELKMGKSTPPTYIEPVYSTCVNWYDGHRLSHSNAVEVCSVMKQQFADQTYAVAEADDFNNEWSAYQKQKIQELSADKNVLIQRGIIDRAPYLDAKVAQCVAYRGKRYAHLQKFGLQFGIETNPVADCAADFRKSLSKAVDQWQYSAQLAVENATSEKMPGSIKGCERDGLMMNCGNAVALKACYATFARPCVGNGDYPCCLVKQSPSYKAAAQEAQQAVQRSDTRVCKVRPTDALVVECGVPEIYEHVTRPGGYVVPECVMPKGFATDVCKVFNPSRIDDLTAVQQAKAAYAKLSHEKGAAIYPGSVGNSSFKDPQIVGTAPDRLTQCQSLLGASECKLAKGSKYVASACCSVVSFLPAVDAQKEQNDAQSAARAAKLAEMQQLAQKLAPDCTPYRDARGRENAFHLVCTSKAKFEACNAVADPIGRYGDVAPEQGYPYARCTFAAPVRGTGARPAPIIIPLADGRRPDASGGRPAPRAPGGDDATAGRGDVRAVDPASASGRALAALNCRQERGTWFCSSREGFTTCEAVASQQKARGCRAVGDARQSGEPAPFAETALKTLGCTAGGRPGMWLCPPARDESLAACQALKEKGLVRACTTRR